MLLLSPLSFFTILLFLLASTANSVHIGKRADNLINEPRSMEIESSLIGTELGLVEIRPGLLLKIETEIEEKTITSLIEMVITEVSAYVETAIETDIITVSEDNIVYKTLFDIATQVTTIQPITEFVTVVESAFEYATEVVTYTESISTSSESVPLLS